MPHHRLADLHTGLDPILAQLAHDAGWRRGGLVLDVACGPGLKSALLKEALGPDGRIVGLDIDVSALHAARSVRAATGLHWLAADALRLPLRSAVAAGAWCVAALGLLPDADAALAEMHRALGPGGALVVVTAERRWAVAHAWPPALCDRLAQALALVPRHHLPQPEPAHDLVMLLRTAGFRHVQGRAYRIEPPALHCPPSHAALPLLPWLALRPLLAPQVSVEVLDEAERGTATPDDAELTTMLIAAIGRRGD